MKSIGGVEVRREDDPAVVAQGGREDGVAEGAIELGADLGLDRVGEGRVGRDEDRRRVGAVLGLGDEVGRDPGRVGGRGGEDHPLRGARPAGRCRPRQQTSILAAVTQALPGPTIRSTGSSPASGRP